MVVLWIISVLPLLDFSALKSQFKSNRFLLLFILFYFWHFIGVLYSNNKEAALFDLEVKLSLCVLPLFFIAIPYNKVVFIQSLKAFVEGCTAALLICILQAAYSFYYTQQASSFFYTELSYFHHPSYASLYAMFAIVLLAEGFFNDSLALFNEKQSFILIGCLFVFILFLFSKIAVILSGILVFYYLFRWYLSDKKSLFKLIWIGILLFLFTAIVIKSEVISNRVKEFANFVVFSNTGNDGGTSLRSFVWKASASLISEKPFVGYGNGDAKEVLLAYYDAHEIKIAGEKKLNAHNQFFQTALSLGIFAALFLLIILFFYMRLAVRKNNIIYIFFLGLVFFNFLVESMLETQAGVVFISFANSLLFWHNKNNNSLKQN
ncbi:hypothetical protein FLAV_00537 [Flavobacteriales bacterium]|nr:hypothetical protein FLAV_00537 [Flavobacteriales bacterium]